MTVRWIVTGVPPDALGIIDTPPRTFGKSSMSMDGEPIEAQRGVDEFAVGAGDRPTSSAPKALTYTSIAAAASSTTTCGDCAGSMFTAVWSSLLPDSRQSDDWLTVIDLGARPELIAPVTSQPRATDSGGGENPVPAFDGLGAARTRSHIDG